MQQPYRDGSNGYQDTQKGCNRDSSERLQHKFRRRSCFTTHLPLYYHILVALSTGILILEIKEPVHYDMGDSEGTPRRGLWFCLRPAWKLPPQSAGRKQDMPLRQESERQESWSSDGVLEGLRSGRRQTPPVSGSCSGPGPTGWTSGRRTAAADSPCSPPQVWRRWEAADPPP